MTGCVERLAVISFDSDCATRLAIHAPALSNPLNRVFQQLLAEIARRSFPRRTSHAESPRQIDAIFRHSTPRHTSPEGAA